MGKKISFQKQSRREFIAKSGIAFAGLTIFPSFDPNVVWSPSALDAAAQDGSVVKDDDRIVFIGDSITAQGVKAGNGGFIALIGEGLRLAHPKAKPTLIGLGGSGSGVNHWQSVEKRSHTEPVSLDIKDTDVGQTLDGGAGIVVVMLGMNDVLAPYLNNTQADFDAWIASYGELVEAVRARSHPRVVGLATVTPCTEDPASPKNLALAEINRRIATMAREKDYSVLPTSEATFEVQALGRTFQPDYHVTKDFVHPASGGHLAIAVGMLRGLGEEAAAAQLLATHAALYRPAADKFPTLSYNLVKTASSPDDNVLCFTVDYQWTSTTATSNPLVKPELPTGWKAEPASLNAAKGRFTFRGPLDNAVNTITLIATNGGETRKQAVTIPAGWRIATGVGKALGWVQNSTYDPANDHQQLDESLAQGDGLSAPVVFPVGIATPWTLYVPSMDYTGLNRLSSVDMAAVTYFKHSQQAYGARWIHSDRDRPVSLDLGTQIFAGTWSLGVWLNGKPAYAGKVPGEPGRKVSCAATLQKGWNLLLFKSTFIQWQWQFSIQVTGQEGRRPR